MPFIPHTPESLLPRSDSKNPAATCCGLTSTGRPCRRAVAPSANFASNYSAARYCWQHKDQAEQHARQPQVPAIQERTSVDTLVERLGLLDIQSVGKDGHQQWGRRRHKEALASRRAPLDDRRESVGPRSNRKTTDVPSKVKPKRKPLSNLGSFCCIGYADNAVVPARPVRVQQNDNRRSAPTKRQPTKQAMQEISRRQSNPKLHNPVSAPRQTQVTGPSNPQTQPRIPTRPSIARHPSSLTSQFLSLIPHNAPPQTISLLLAELAKPISPFDEPGYIYIFWLTPTSLPSAPVLETPSSLLSPPSPPLTRPRPRPPHHRRTSSVLETYAMVSESAGGGGNGIGGVDEAGGGPRKTILLKIGRASNVQRRLNEWTRQCGYNLTLVRYYPYPSSSSSSSTTATTTSPSPSSPSSSSPLRPHPSKPTTPLNTNPAAESPCGLNPPLPQKVPHAHRIERLIHIELADKRAKTGSSGAAAATAGGGVGGAAGGRERGASCLCVCGKEHREWFEVEATRRGVREVDEVVRRWVAWGVGAAGHGGGGRAVD